MAQPIQYQGMPPQNVPMLESDGTMNIVWYRFFQSLWRRTGLNTSNFGISAPNSFDGSLVQRVYPQFYATDPNSAATKVVTMIDQTKGTLIGIFNYTP